MRKIILMGRSESGKTTLTQALRGERIRYRKTQYVNHFDVVIDTPGEYIQTKQLGYALAWKPTRMVDRDVVGIVTKIHEENADAERAARWLRLAGCRKIFKVDSKRGEGVAGLLEYLREEGDVLPSLLDDTL